MSAQPIWIPGKPAPAGTPGEKLWKEQIQHHSASRQASRNLRLQFSLPEELAESTGQVELERWCEPVLSVLINKLGWMDAKRQQLSALRVTKQSAEPAGLKVWTDDKGSAAAFDSLYGEPILDVLFEGTLPSKASDPYIAELLKKLQLNMPGGGTSKYAVRLMLGGSKVNIGEVMTGTVKAVLGSLYPVLGGDAAKPEDWRIEALDVEKNAPQTKENAVRISIWTIS